MKEPYFTPESIYKNSKDMLEKIQRFVGRGSRVFKPRDSALIVIDMQRYFLEPEFHAYIPAARAIVPGIKRLVDLFASCGRPVFFTQHGNTQEDAAMLGEWWSDILRKGEKESEIIQELDTSKGVVVEKCQYDAFYKTALQEHLKKEGVKQVVVCGVMTHLCCETTARSAFVRGFEVFFPINGNATACQEFHFSTLLNLAHGFASLVLVEDLCKAVEEER